MTEVTQLATETQISTLSPENEIPVADNVKVFHDILQLSANSEIGPTPCSKEDIADIAGVFIGIKPMCALSVATYAWLQEGLAKVSHTYENEFDFIPIKESEIAARAKDNVFLVNKRSTLQKIANNQDIFPQISHYDDFRIIAHQYLSTASEDELVQKRTGILLGYPKEDVEAYVRYSKAVGMQLNAHVDNWRQIREMKDESGNEIFTKEEINRLEFFLEATTLNFRDVARATQYELADMYQPEVEETVKKIPNVSPQVADYFLRRRLLFARGIIWISVGSPEQRRKYIENVEDAFEETGINNVLEEFNLDFKDAA